MPAMVDKGVHIHLRRRHFVGGLKFDEFADK